MRYYLSFQVAVLCGGYHLEFVENLLGNAGFLFDDIHGDVGVESDPEGFEGVVEEGKVFDSGVFIVPAW